MATRAAGGKVLNAIAARVPELVGGSADLNPSTETALKGAGDFEPPSFTDGDRQGAVGGDWSYAGRNLHFGVREHAMGAICNGIARHGGLVPFAATFFIFSDYMRPAIRLAALMQLHVDLRLHPRQHRRRRGRARRTSRSSTLAALRAIPNLTVIRPADANETGERLALRRSRTAGPVALLLTRQDVPVLDRRQRQDVAQGGYVLADSVRPARRDPDRHRLRGLARRRGAAAAGRPRDQGAGRQPALVGAVRRAAAEYRDAVLPPAVLARVAVEAGIPLGWEKYAGPFGAIVAIAGRFGASAPLKIVLEKYGFTAENVAAKAAEVVEQLPARLKAIGLARA